MGQKTHPIGFRLGIIRTWDSKWFAAKNYALFLHEDLRMKKFLKERLYQAGISKMEIERAANKDKRAKMNIWTSRPGIVIGQERGRGREPQERASEAHRQGDHTQYHRSEAAGG